MGAEWFWKISSIVSHREGTRSISQNLPYLPAEPSISQEMSIESIKRPALAFTLTSEGEISLRRWMPS
jgi:hypothetical protein